jgi:SMC interacting uncharacterized protein involved in chromosome segregation
MPRNLIKTEPLTNAEKQQRFRSKQRKNMTIDQEEAASKKIWKELRDILDSLTDSELYAVAPVLRYMKICHKKLNEKELESISAELDKFDFDLSFFPGAEYNRDDEENAEYDEE